MTTFETDDGREVGAVTADEMREVDRVAVEEFQLGLLQMMENAGRNLAATAREMHDGADDPVVVLAGSGGNGGGGLCAARHLENHGVAVEVVLDRDPGDLRGAAGRQFAVLDAMEVPLASDARGAIESAGLVVDALVGYGLRDAPRGRVAQLVEACEEASRVLALDVPSGVDATTGETPGVAVVPDRTLTLALPKTGLTGIAGEVVLADISIPATVYDRVGIEYESPFDGRYRVPIHHAG